MSNTRVWVEPERFVAGGEALARDAGGRVVFVRGALPGERVEVELTETKKDWARGFAVTVDVGSVERVEPPCPQRRLGCGGCDWQHVRAGHQIHAKTAVVTEALERTGRLSDPAVRTGASVPHLAARTTIRVVGTGDGVAGFRKERSNEVVSAAGCLIAHPALVDAIAGLTITPGLEVTLRVSVATGQMTAVWSDADGVVSGLGEAVGIGPDAEIHEEVAGHRFVVSAASFFQSGPAAAELLVDAVRRITPELDHAKTVLDAYAGVGLFAVAATSAATRVVLIESSRSAIGDARRNLTGRDAHLVCAEVGRWERRGESVDVVIADPARSGLGRPGVAALSATDAPVITLVSCDPVSLARDAQLLDAVGYGHVVTEVLDLFPHTHHVETVTRFDRR